MGPFTHPKEKAVWRVDHADDAVRGALVLEGGQLRWPAPPLAVSAGGRLAGGWEQEPALQLFASSC